MPYKEDSSQAPCPCPDVSISPLLTTAAIPCKCEEQACLPLHWPRSKDCILGRDTLDGSVVVAKKTTILTTLATPVHLNRLVSHLYQFNSIARKNHIILQGTLDMLEKHHTQKYDKYVCLPNEVIEVIEAHMLSMKIHYTDRGDKVYDKLHELLHCLTATCAAGYHLFDYKYFNKEVERFHTGYCWHPSYLGLTVLEFIEKDCRCCQDICTCERYLCQVEVCAGNKRDCCEGDCCTGGHKKARSNDEKTSGGDGENSESEENEETNESEENEETNESEENEETDEIEENEETDEIEENEETNESEDNEETDESEETDKSDDEECDCECECKCKCGCDCYHECWQHREEDLNDRRGCRGKDKDYKKHLMHYLQYASGIPGEYRHSGQNQSCHSSYHLNNTRAKYKHLIKDLNELLFKHFRLNVHIVWSRLISRHGPDELGHGNRGHHHQSDALMAFLYAPEIAESKTIKTPKEAMHQGRTYNKDTGKVIYSGDANYYANAASFVTEIAPGASEDTKVHEATARLKWAMQALDLEPNVHPMKIAPRTLATDDPMNAITDPADWMDYTGRVIMVDGMDMRSKRGEWAAECEEEEYPKMMRLRSMVYEHEGTEVKKVRGVWYSGKE